MSSLTAIFGSSDEKSQDSEKLLNLYWNRAELKKEFAGMRKQQFKLQDRIKQQEGAKARLQQKLDHLEDLLVDPDWASNVVVFYQFRALTGRCEAKVARFAEQLKQQREQKQQSSVLAEWNEQQSREARVIEHQILDKRDSVQRLEDQLQAERRRLASMSGFVRFFRRRTVTSILDKLAEQIETVQLEEAELTNGLSDIKGRTPPDSAGLDIATKRTINLMILSFVQQLFVQFGSGDLAGLAKEAGEKSVGAIKYGNRDDCNELLGRISKQMELMEQATDFAGILQKRAKLLGDTAQFRQDTDAVPAASSVATLYQINAKGVVQESEADLLGQNFFGITNALSR